MFQLLGITVLCTYLLGVFCVGEYDKYGSYPTAGPGPASPLGLLPNGRGPGPAPRGPVPVTPGDYTGALDFCVSTVEDPDADCIPGQGGSDYPVYDQIPDTGFSCQGEPLPGYYADPAAGCQVFHICQHDGRQDSFLCPKGTVFNQQYFVCDWWYNFDCSRAPSLYGVNAELFIEPPRSPYANGYERPALGGVGPAVSYPAPLAAAPPPAKANGY